MQPQTKILLVDDDRDLVDMLRYIFQREGYTIITAYDGEVALRAFKAESPDLIVLDLSMPKRSGFQVLQEIRRMSKVPVIVLTCLGDEDHLVTALEGGADDYLAKPFRPRELKARTSALLRRAQHGKESRDKALKPLLLGDISLNAKTTDVFVAGRVVKLTRTEFALLQYLMVNYDIVLSQSDIIANVWGFDAEGNDDLVRVTISRLRRKIEPDPTSPRYIVTVPGVGYRFIFKHQDD
jgi:two-component system response regulator VicR